MKLIHFSCSNLNLFISREITFFNDVSFLHGINGSGKTTILRAIASLLTPDPFWLANATYDTISVTIQHNEKTSVVCAKKDDSAVTLKVTGSVELEDTFPAEDLRRLSAIIDEDVYRSASEPELVAQRLRNYMGNLKTFSFVSDLPTPIFLGLDRTTLTPSAVNKSIRNPGRGPRSVHPYFRTQLDDAIIEAERLLTRQLSTLSNERNKIFANLRNQLVLSMFAAPISDSVSLKNVETLTEKLVGIRSSVIAALQKINISQIEIDKAVEPFFKEAVSVTRTATESMKEIEKRQPLKAGKSIQPYIEKINPFMNLLPSISIIMRTLDKIEEANNSERILSRPLETYKALMNSFFGDSGKTLLFEENAIRVQLPSNTTTDLTSLSSGERQIFVLITHLFFNPSIRGENILLIDEPELSLHLKWQRQFVSAIRTASPSTQIVLATHSPEIVYSMDDHLISLDNNFSAASSEQ
jgi:ABC-type cobalamin/Fe3+-siderophores transport system ATPase subunit